ncbi:D-arabinono-1,4-lactone oxidase [Wenyingzhuangia sp. IMCC45574]
MSSSTNVLPKSTYNTKSIDSSNKENLWVSWNENVSHSYNKLISITSEEQLSKVIAQSNSVRVFGNRYSSSDISAGTDTLINIENYNKIITVNQATKEITVQPGITLEKVIKEIQNLGWCIPCLPDIDKVTIGGALATGTHGTNGFILAKYVSKFRMVLADGSIKEYTDENSEMDALRLSLGTLGVFSEITFACEDNYRLHLKEAPQKDSTWLLNIDKYLKNYDFVRVLWLPHTDHGYVILGNKVSKEFKFVPKDVPKYIKYRRKTSKFLYQFTTQNPKFTVLANKILFNLFFRAKKEHAGSLYDATVTKKRGASMELAEWTIAYSKFQDLFKELKEVLNSNNNNAFVHVPMDVRFIKKDNTWLSYAYNEDAVSIGCVCRNSPAADSYEAFDKVEDVFLKHGGKPHWGKRFKAKYHELSKLYPKWNDFVELRNEMDPKGKFLNKYLSQVFLK